MPFASRLPKVLHYSEARKEAFSGRLKALDNAALQKKERRTIRGNRAAILGTEFGVLLSLCPVFFGVPVPGLALCMYLPPLEIGSCNADGKM